MATKTVKLKAKPEDVCVVFGRNVKRLRQAHGWMQSDLAAYTGLERAYLSRVESGKVEPCLRSIQTIATELGATIGELVGEA